MDDFFTTLTASAEGNVANAHGWISEELEHEKVEGKARGYYFAIGWESVDAHMRFRETKPFAESIPALRNVSKAMNMVSWMTSAFLEIRAKYRVASYLVHKVLGCLMAARRRVMLICDGQL